MSDTPSAADPHPRKRVRVRDSEMAYVEAGVADGRPIVFLHGNPTSSYLWRNVIPHLTDHGRCLAPDLIGMGDSGASGDGDYTFATHAAYLDAWFDAMDLREAVLVIHDWGSALGFHWARRNPDRVAAIAYMEALVRPVTWDEWPDNSRAFFQSLRSPAGEKIVIERNLFVERLLPAGILRELSEAEIAYYGKRFTEPGESRRPTLTWPRQIPIDGEPADVTAIGQAYSEWLAASEIPKLFINAEPGAILIGAQREFCRSWPNQIEITVNGLHFVQEDAPDEIGTAVAALVNRL
ncbi:MAG: haloalkane dehalogenase [Alphaproteobacteria bacterium]